MSRYFGPIGLAAAGLMLAVAAEASLAGQSGRDPTFQQRTWESRFIQRYPGDQAFAGGTVRFQGPEKGPYVERCHWTANPGVFGAPFGLTQRCVRYTLENTPE
jgi:hypothetical protein